MAYKNFVAADLGASNGRTIVGRFDGQRIVLEELNRFDNQYIRVGDAFYWDILYLYRCIWEGLGHYAHHNAEALSGIGIDTWGVDFGLIDKQGRLAGNPRSYRDPRVMRGFQAFFNKNDQREVFNLTGIANIQINTAYQLYDMVASKDPQLETADKLLMLPDLLGYMFSGAATTEFTNATTMQMLDLKGKWSADMIGRVGIARSLLTDIQMSGEVKGTLLQSVAEDVGLKDTPAVICVGSHDTASAVASVPAAEDDFAFISSGTWSLMGVLSDTPIINDDAYFNHFSNEGTVSGGYRPLRNVMGLWIIQGCKRCWDGKEKLCWDDIVGMAKGAPALNSLIDVNADLFFDGINTPQKIQQFCRDTSQPVPQTMGEIARVVYESLAMSYRETFMGLEKLKGKRIDTLYIVGGGSKNKLLNQMTANAINRPVVAGPSEATAIGNLMIQAMAIGDVNDAQEIRQVVRQSFSVETYLPKETQKWEDAYGRYQMIVEKSRIPR